MPATRPWLPCILTCSILLAYANSFRGTWIFDDYTYILHNLQLRDLWPPSYLAGNTRPLLFLTLALNRALSGTAIWSFHAFNLAIHIASTLLLYGLVRRSLLLPRLAPEFAKHSHLYAFTAALFWGLHPLTTMAVTYIWQRGESLCALFYLLSLYAVVRSINAARTPAWQAVAVIACVAGMCTKEVMVSAPLTALLYDLVLVSGSFSAFRRSRLRLHLMLMAAWLVFGALVVFDASQFHSSLGVGFGSLIFTPAEYARTMPGVLLHYLRLSVWPDQLCFDYAWPPTENIRDAIVPGLAVILLLLLAARGLLRQRPWSIPLAAFFLILAPSSSVMPMPDAAVEYRMYLPLAAVLILLTTGAGRLIGIFFQHAPLPPRTGRLAGLLILSIALALGACTAQRNTVYASKLRLWDLTARQRPNNPRAWHNLGIMLLRKHEYAQAELAFRQSLRVQERLHAHARTLARARGKHMVVDNAQTYYELGLSLLMLNRPQEAIAVLQHAVSISPNHAEAHYVLAQALADLGKREEAVRHARVSLRLAPNQSRTRRLLADLTGVNP